MDFRIADTFTDSLARLTADEQKAVKTTAFDLQLNPATPGMSFHRLDNAKDKNFWSVRVSSDLRLIVHKTSGSLMLCYVDHHDKAYEWAERRRLEIHPTTGAAQLVEVRETVIFRDVMVPRYQQVDGQQASSRPSPFARLSDAELLGFGVPAEWIGHVRSADEETILDVAAHLPAEAAEAMLELAIGGKPKPAHAAGGGQNPFEHPDAQRRFRNVESAEELQRAFDFPWEKWTVFLHPQQQDIVRHVYSGPARVTGSAGTGKTIVALHRAVHLARINGDARVLLTTFSEPLAQALHTKLKRLIAAEPRLGDRIDVQALDSIGERLYRAQLGPVTIAGPAPIRDALEQSRKSIAGHQFSAHFVAAEWEQIVDAWQLSTWEQYRDVARLGRKTRLSDQQRQKLWAIFEQVQTALNSQGLKTRAKIFTELAAALSDRKTSPFDHVIADEAQDFGVAHLRFFAALGGGRTQGLFFAGDLGQRIFQTPFSWRALGVDVRGRARALKVNYRTSHQIRSHADRLLDSEMVDIDGNREDRAHTVSVFNGPPPTISVSKDVATEANSVATWLQHLSMVGVRPHEIGVFVRSDAQIARAREAVHAAGLTIKVLDERVETTSGHVAVGAMHLAKGLEFRAVVVMACDDEVVPLQARIESVGDDADLQEVYDTERHLLYVACTRARDHLLVSGVEPASEFLDDLRRGKAETT